MKYTARNVKYHPGLGGIGLRWPVRVQPLGSAAEDKGAGHKGPGRETGQDDDALIKLKAPVMHPCVFHRCIHLALKQLSGEILHLWPTVAARLWEHVFHNREIIEPLQRGSSCTSVAGGRESR